MGGEFQAAEHAGYFLLVHASTVQDPLDVTALDERVTVYLLLCHPCHPPGGVDAGAVVSTLTPKLGLGR